MKYGINSDTYEFPSYLVLTGQYFAKIMFVQLGSRLIMLLTFQHLLFPQVAQEAQDLEEGLRGK